MDTTSLIEYIIQTKKLGSSLISSKYNDSEFADYLSNVDIIIKCVDSLAIDDLIIERTIELLKKSRPDDYRLNWMMKIYYALLAPKVTKGLFLTNNSDEQINMRFIFEANSRLSILANSRKIEKAANSGS